MCLLRSRVRCRTPLDGALPRTSRAKAEVEEPADLSRVRKERESRG